MKQTVVALCIFLSFNAFAAKNEDPVVATVNGHNIRHSEFDQTYKQNLLFVSDKLVSKEKVLKDLINRELGIQKARKAKLDDDPTVKQKMEDVLYHAQISKDLEPRLKKITVSDDEVKAYYKEHPEYRTAHILFRVRAPADEKEAEEALKQALRVYKTLQSKPDKFSELANKFSQSAVAPNGGDMGFQPAIRLAPEYFAAIKGKSKGTITRPVRTQYGYHIIKVLAEKDFSDVNQALYKKIVYDEKRDKVLEQYFAELRKGASININQKYLK